MVPRVVQIILWSRTLVDWSRVVLVTGFVAITMSAAASPAVSARSATSRTEIRGVDV
jgi:hypothetical protein